MPRSREQRRWSWPGGEAIAVSVGLALEDFEFSSQYVQSPTPGKRDKFSLSFGEYGARTGIWRLLDLLDEFDVKGNMSTNGLTAQRYPELVRAVSDAGHEINGHGWVNDVRPDTNIPDAERDEIRRCMKALTEATGTRPIGWTGPASAGSDKTLQILAEEGFIWNGDEAADDLPYLKHTAAGRIVVLPRTNIFHNDLAMWLFGRNPPGVIWDNFHDTFDELYAEGIGGYPKWTEITLHAHVAGRPTLIPSIRKCLRYAMDHGGVWFAPRRDIARWALEREGLSLGSKSDDMPEDRAGMPQNHGDSLI